MFQDSVNFDMVFVRGIRHALFGADWLFIARLTGPGNVWLQSLTVPSLAHAFSPYLGGEQALSTAEGVTGGMVAGNILGDIFGRN